MNITTQKQLRALFWATFPDLPRRPGPQNAQPCDTHNAFCDWIESLARDGQISATLAQRATL
jgi:hypothetical protein